MPQDGWFTAPLVSARSCGERVSYFEFDKPAGYGFRPGQYMMVRLETAEGPQTKPFTISAPPSDPHLEVTTRISPSPFKQALAALRPGQEVEVSSARGKTVLPEDVRHVVFLTGGVGITPASSMLREAARQARDGVRSTLLYGNVDDACVPFLDELRSISQLGWCDLVLVFEKPPESWRGETGFITSEMVSRHLAGREPDLYIVSGPPAMVGAMERVLDELDVSAELRMIERFSGY